MQDFIKRDISCLAINVSQKGGDTVFFFIFHMTMADFCWPSGEETWGNVPLNTRLFNVITGDELTICNPFKTGVCSTNIGVEVTRIKFCH